MTHDTPTPDVSTEVERWIAAVAGDGALAGTAARECRSLIERRLSESQEKIERVEREHQFDNEAWARDNARLRETEQRATAAEAQVRALREALTKLANETDGFVSMADPANHGHTNIAVLKQRIDAARAALAKEPTK